MAGAQVDDLRAGMAGGIVAGQDMALGQIHHMDIVPDACAVGGGIVIAKDRQLFQLAHGDLGDEGHQVVGNAGRILADEAGSMGADGVEVAQQNHTPLRIGSALALQDLLDHVLGPAVGIGAAQGNHILPVGYLGLVAVDGGRGGENQAFDAMGLHSFAESQGGIQIVAVVAQGLATLSPTALRPAKWITQSKSFSLKIRSMAALSATSAS